MNKRKASNVYQFKISLIHTKPPIWRRIQVPEDYSLWGLHCALQDSMGWHDSHMHKFEIIDPNTGAQCETGMPHEMGMSDIPLIDERNAKIAQYFSDSNKRAGYEYDFGDSWEHIIEFEKIVPMLKNVSYPQCIAGKRAGPPEDCGGVWGFKDHLKIMSDPNHEEYEEHMEWLREIDGPLRPEVFEPKSVVFHDPKVRQNMRYGRF